VPSSAFDTAWPRATRSGPGVDIGIKRIRGLIGSVAPCSWVAGFEEVSGEEVVTEVEGGPTHGGKYV
jgi:hypothetical protein